MQSRPLARLDSVRPPGSSDPVVPKRRTAREMRAVRPSGSQQAVVAPLPASSPPVTNSRRPGTLTSVEPWRTSGEFRRPSGELRALPVRRASGELEAVTAISDTTQTTVRPNRQLGIAAFAGFGPPPNQLLHMPAYSLRVVRRTLVLRRFLAIAREQGSQDVRLYEASLRSANMPTVMTGFGVMALALLLLGLLATLSVSLLG